MKGTKIQGKKEKISKLHLQTIVLLSPCIIIFGVRKEATENERLPCWHYNKGLRNLRDSNKRVGFLFFLNLRAFMAYQSTFKF